MTLELATIFAQFSDEFCSTQPMSANQQRVHRAVLACRTPALGVQMYRCDQCDFEQPRYCSCRNRHCPKCQAAVRAQWVEDRSEDVIDAPYFHLVFTLPHELNPLARRHPALLYGLLFETAWSVLNSLARDRLEGQLGMTAVLHTWGQTLTQHIHLHCLIPGGAFDAKRGRWHRARSPYKTIRCCSATAITGWAADAGSWRWRRRVHASLSDAHPPARIHARASLRIPRQPRAAGAARTDQAALAQPCSCEPAGVAIRRLDATMPRLSGRRAPTRPSLDAANRAGHPIVDPLRRLLTLAAGAVNGRLWPAPAWLPLRQVDPACRGRSTGIP